MLRHFSTLAILAFFVAMMTLLTRDHIMPWIERGDAIPVSMAQVIDAWTGQDEYLHVSVNGRRVGHVRNVNSRRIDGGDGFESFTTFELAGAGLQARLVSTTLANERLELEQVRLAAYLGGHDEAAIELAGLVHQGTLHLRLESNTGVRYHQMRLREPITMNFAVEPFMASNEMTPGERYAMHIFDPLFGTQSGRLTLEMTGRRQIFVDQERVDATVVEARLQGALMTIYLDENRIPVRREVRLGGGPQTQAASMPEIVLQLDLAGPRSELRSLESLQQLPDPPDYTIEDFRGVDSGEPVGALGLFPMTLREGSLNLFAPGRGAQED